MRKRKLRVIDKHSRREQRFMELKYRRLFPETGDRLWAFRETLGMTQAAMADECGLSAGCISRYECGYTQGFSKNLAKFAKAFGVSVDFLLNLSDSQRISDPVITSRRKHG